MKRLAACIVLSLAIVLSAACGRTSSVANPEDKNVIGVVEVRGGEMLERDIIPQLCKVYSLPEQEVKDTLAAAPSSALIGIGLTGFRKMEGMIPPGQYEIIEGSTLEETVAGWVQASEQRYSRLLATAASPNGLSESERLSLASMVEAECLAGEHQEETATVFLNRLKDGSKLQSCVTAEYALGYQRPYLTSEDIAVKSEYNTYYVPGLPAGPICAVSDASLKAAMGTGNGTDIYFFYYDYVLDDMFFFEDYAQFQKDGKVSGQRFDEN